MSSISEKSKRSQKIKHSEKVRT